MHLFGFIVRIYHDARSSECQIPRFEFESRQGQVFSLLETVHTVPTVHTVHTVPRALQLPIQRCLEVTTPEIKELEPEADYLPPHSADVKNAWIHTSNIASRRAQGQVYLYFCR